MPFAKIAPIIKVCPQCGKQFEVGGRGRAPKEQVYCSRRCNMLVRPLLERPGSHAPRPKRYKDTLHDEAWLRARYVDERLSLRQISDLIGAPKPTVRWSLHKWGIEVRGNGEGRRVLFDVRGRKVATQAEMVAAYGGRCECCGEIELAFLSLDHTNGGGSAERRKMGGGQALLNSLKASGWPKDGYRVLCMNCQFGTKYNRVCPHRVSG